MRTLSVALAALLSAAVFPLAAGAQSINVQVGTDRPSVSTGVNVRERTTVSEPQESTTVRRRTIVEDEPEERTTIRRRVRTVEAGSSCRMVKRRVTSGGVTKVTRVRQCS